MAKKVVVSGLQPSGTLHIGNYLGMLKNATALQEKKDYERFYFIADYHSLTQKFTPKEKREDILNLAVDLLAAGLNPKKSTLFAQSHINEHANLAWILNTITSVGELERMIEYKEKIKQGQVPNAGLFDYPVLMAADILIYKANFVPVGEDQRQHLELTRTIARNFNKRFGKTFPEPENLPTTTPRVMSLSNPEEKMSKSLPKGCLFLSDSEKEIKSKVMSAQTDSQSSIGYDPNKRPAVSNLVSIYAGFANTKPEKVVKDFRGKGYADFKKALAKLIVDELKPFHKKRAELMKDKKKVMKILDDGASVARPIAQKTLEEVKTALRDLRKVGVDILTLGQYLKPDERKLEVEQFIHPEIFAELESVGKDMGFKEVFSGPYVRSSYHAAESFERVCAS